MNNSLRPVRLATALRLAAVAACALGLATNAISADDDAKGEAPAGSGLRLGVESLQVEAASLPDHPSAQRTAALRLRWVASIKPAAGLELRAGLRTDFDHQGGGSESDDTARAALTDTYLRWRSGDARMTAGLQTVLWGRVDAISLIDRVSRVDLRRFALDELKDRRLPQPALRWEHTWGSVQSDLVLLVGHLNTLLPQDNSAWHPVNRREAHILGTPAAPALAAFYAVAPLREQNHRHGGAALRLTHTGDGLDLGFTAGRVRQPLPFFALETAAPAIRASHPFNRFVAADLELATDAVTWRAELAHTRDVPMTVVASGRQLNANATEFASGAEFFPGGRDTRVNLQLLLRSVDAKADTVELQRYSSLSGEVETSFAQGKVKAGLRFASALNIHDVYLSPRLSYLGWEPHDLYVAAHVFKGEPRGFGGFFRNTNALAVGVKTRF